MSSGAYLRISGLLVDEARNDINPGVMMLFREGEKEVIETVASEYESSIEAGSEDDFALQTLTYRVTVSVLRDRLDLLGFSLALAEERFNRGIAREVQKHNELIRSWHSNGVLDELPSDVPTNLTPTQWTAALKQIRDENLFLRIAHPLPMGLPPIIQFMLRGSKMYTFGFPDYDIRVALRLMLEAFGADDEVEYDLTELLSGGWVDTHEDLVKHAEYLIAEDFVESRRIVVLTEGKTDKEFVERSLRLLYPHLADYFAFMDFDGARVEGGSGALANMVKAFVGAGILNRILALFDNDAAGRSAIESLRRLTIPDNIVVLTFPALEFAKQYPTLGPSGVAELDVNGLAGSIELYFGEDVLRVADGNFAPVHWKGFNDRLNCYQGQITHKAALHDRFRRKLSACEADSEAMKDYDWSSMEQIIRGMCSAFHESTAKQYREEYEAWDAS